MSRNIFVCLFLAMACTSVGDTLARDIAPAAILAWPRINRSLLPFNLTSRQKFL